MNSAWILYFGHWIWSQMEASLHEDQTSGVIVIRHIDERINFICIEHSRDGFVALHRQRM